METPYADEALSKIEAEYQKLLSGQISRTAFILYVADIIDAYGGDVVIEHKIMMRDAASKIPGDAFAHSLYAH